MEYNYLDTASRKALARKYAESVDKREKDLADLLGEDKSLFFSSCFSNSFYYNDFKDALFNKNIRPSDYIRSKLSWMFGTYIEIEFKDILLECVDKVRDYSYSTSVYRRSTRSTEYPAYFYLIFNMIRSFSFKNIVNVHLSDLLDGKIDESTAAYIDYHHSVSGGYNCWQVAYALDHEDHIVEEAVKRILFEENNTHTLTFTVIDGIVYSHRTDFHQYLGKLLLSAQRQEGLRQAICERADMGTSSAFFEILRIIDENDLIRFSAVKRSVSTWLGLVSDYSGDAKRISEKCVSLMVSCLNDVNVQQEYLRSEDSMKIYVALWSIGFSSIERIASYLMASIESMSIHQLMVTGLFVSNLDMPRLMNQLAKIVVKKHINNKKLLAVWVHNFIRGCRAALWDHKNNKKIYITEWFDNTAEVEEYYQIFRGIYDNFSQTVIISPCVFDWYTAELSKQDVALKLCFLAFLSKNERNIDYVSSVFNDCDTHVRGEMFNALFGKPTTGIQRNTVVYAIANKETRTREYAYSIADNLVLDDEYSILEEHLRLKNSQTRQYSVKLLLKQKDDKLSATVDRLIASDKEDIRLGGFELLLHLKENKQRQLLFERCLKEVAEKYSNNKCITLKEKTYLENLGIYERKKGNDLTLSTAEYRISDFDEGYIDECLNVFMRYFPDSALASEIKSNSFNSSINRIKEFFEGPSICSSAADSIKFLSSFAEYLESKKLYEFTAANGETHLLCEMENNVFLRNGEEPYCSELWKKWIADSNIGYEQLLRSFILLMAHNNKTEELNVFKKDIETVYGKGFSVCPPMPYQKLMFNILQYYYKQIPKEDLTKLSVAVNVWFIKCGSSEKVINIKDRDYYLQKDRIIAYPVVSLKQILLLYSALECERDCEIEKIFPIKYASVEKTRRIIFGKSTAEFRGNHIYIDNGVFLMSRLDLALPSHAYVCALLAKVITKEQFLGIVLKKENLPDMLNFLSSIKAIATERDTNVSNKRRYSFYFIKRVAQEFFGTQELDFANYSEEIELISALYDEIVPYVVSKELARGESSTEFSVAAKSIQMLYGVKYFVEILLALGNDKLDRSSFFLSENRKGCFSYLLSVCVPSSSDSVEDLKKAIEGTGISDIRLVEAALYSPEWIPLIGEYLKVATFESLCYYFMAHTSESSNDKKNAIIAKYTPLKSEELSIGAFDVKWFKDVYSSVDEKFFKLVYDAAKYVSDGAKHTRARKYADASLGKMKTEDVERLISDKRNKDLIMAYALIPIKDNNDLTARYLYIQKYKKESKKFGSQRSMSEGKAADMALKNLAINAGFEDMTYFTLVMEDEIVSSKSELFGEHLIDGVVLTLSVTEEGQVALKAEMNGKKLNSIPASIKKTEKVAELLEFKKKLTELYSRSKAMLEQGMEERTGFRYGDLLRLVNNPIVYPMLTKTVWICENKHGFFKTEGLCSADGTVYNLKLEDVIVIAHPYDLYKAGGWVDYQKYLYDTMTVQPFKQVFRELYIKTDEEKDLYKTLRYAGNQLQPNKAYAVLSKRKWVCDPDEGLQRVYYRDNIIAQMYALADWFSPADIEAPTLEWVCFFNRSNGKCLKIDEVPEVIFSEIMRDVDLAVSVAHAGGVDPEASHSTIEMRAAILEFVLPLFKITNTKIEKSHAIIDGKLAQYSVHLGSGVVHQIGEAMIPVLPAHSQHRGRIFLPFVDDDPKTAEVISKVLLFAEDTKIKDPAILANIIR